MASPLPERFLEAEKFRAQVAAREARAVAVLARSWERSVKLIAKDIEAVLAKIEQARAKDIPINRDWIRRLQENRKLQSQIIAQAKLYSDTVARRLQNETEWAARTGATHAERLQQLSFAEPIRAQVSFRTITPEQVLAIGQRVAPSTPTGKLLKRIAADTADEAASVLIDGITRGKNVKVIGRELARVSNIPRARAQLIARTEIFGAYRDSHHEQMLANREILDSWVWMAQLGAACGGCLAMHGSVHELEEFMPAHPNCQCEPIPMPKSFKDLGLPEELDVGFEPTFDPQKMKDAAAREIKKPLNELEARFGKGKAAGLKSGKIKLDDMSKKIENKVWGDSIVEKPLKELIA